MLLFVSARRRPYRIPPGSAVIAAAAMLCLLVAEGLASQVGTTPAATLKVVVIAGEDAVNIIQQKTAVAPVVEIRDRNDLPVSGAAVTFTISGGNTATFAGGVQTLTVTTNAAGRAVVGALNPLGSGAFQINVQAAFQGQTAVAAIAQTNVLTAAEAATASASGAAGSGTSGATGGAGGGGGLSNTAITGIVGGAAAATAVAAAAAGGGDSSPSPTPPPAGNTSKTYTGQFAGTLLMTFAGNPGCTRNEAQTGTLQMNLTDNNGAITGTASVRGNIVITPGSCDPSLPPNNNTDTFNLNSAAVSGTAGSLSFSGTASNTFPAGPGTGAGVNSYSYSFAGALSGGSITGTLSVHREIAPPAPSPPNGTGTVVHSVTLR